MRHSLAILIAVSLSAPLAAQDGGHSGHGSAAGSHPCQSQRIGDVSFANSGSRDAQRSFQSGVALLHSFMYPEAADCFRDAQRADSTFAMAYWGEALTYIHTGWRSENPEAARAALGRLAPSPEARLARAGTARERAYGSAVEALVAAGAAEAVRVRGFATGMRAVLDANPADIDAQAFTALSAMLVNYFWPPADSATREREHDAAEALAMKVMREHPTHPGGVHYVIHIDDDPRYASRALAAARAYARVAPDAEHALHMPSHIFVQLGMWDEAAASDERAWHASRLRVAGRGESGASLDFHSLQWLQYEYLQQGRIAAAAALIDTARLALRNVPADFDGSPDAQFAVGVLTFRLAAESGTGWREAIAAAPVPTATPGSVRAAVSAVASRYFVAAANAMTGDSSAARLVAERLRQEAASATLSASGRRARMVYAEQIVALIAQSRGDWEAAAQGFERAATIEDSIPPLGPPTALPSHEWLGAALLRSGRPADAVSAYTRALARRPNRPAALRGLAQAQLALSQR